VGLPRAERKDRQAGGLPATNSGRSKELSKPLHFRSCMLATVERLLFTPDMTVYFRRWGFGIEPWLTP